MPTPRASPEPKYACCHLGNVFRSHPAPWICACPAAGTRPAGCQIDIAWAQHLVWVYPIWWGGLPALLKGFLDRIFLPGFAFKYRANSVLWDRLLTGRTAELLVTMDTPPWYYRWVQRQPGHRQMKQTILEFSGIRPVRVHSFGPVVNSSDAARAGWIKHACKLGARAGA
jgi:putative NADPH-quinone reductase